MKTIHPTERQTQQAIIGYLKYKGWMVMRLNSGKFSVGEGANRRFIMGQEKGTPDIMAFRLVSGASTDLCDVLFVEVKAHGNKPTLSQTEKMKELISFGAQCIVAYSVDDLERAGI